MTSTEAVDAVETTVQTIAEVARWSGVSAHTLRYYERIGLLAVRRDPAGRRRYQPDDLRRVTFITRLRQTGMPIRQIQRYFAMADAGPQTEPQRLRLLVEHRDSVRAQLDTLRAALDTVEFKITCYGGSAAP